MKKPLQAILMAPEFYAVCKSGEKQITICEGHRSYDLGFAVLCSHIANWCMPVVIRSVTHTTISNVSVEDYVYDGFSGRADLLDGLQRFYPSLTFSSPVTVIRWEKG